MRTNAFTFTLKLKLKLKLKLTLQAAIRAIGVGWTTLPKLTSRHPPFHSMGRPRLATFRCPKGPITNATPNMPANERPPALLR